MEDFYKMFSNAGQELTELKQLRQWGSKQVLELEDLQEAMSLKTLSKRNSMEQPKKAAV